MSGRRLLFGWSGLLGNLHSEGYDMMFFTAVLFWMIAWGLFCDLIGCERVAD